MTEQKKLNGVEEQLTENQRAVQAKLKKSIKAGRIPREVAKTTIDNFLTVFREDENFADLRFNVLSSRPERVSADGRREWTASDDAWSRGYIEEVYEIHSQSKWQDAFIQMQGERAYNPAQDIVGSVQWDGESRCESFLIDWMGAEDTPYNREVSRLIFAGGINRLYDPGCKFDCVPVLIGAQGGGKSTICHWLALEDEFYSSINTIEGQKGAEGIQGVWVCEIEELLAILANDRAGSAREEKAKAFISKQDEYYRQPYTKRPVHHLRQCIFIGTTNRDTFLTDKTGARRWFPVKVHSVAQDLYDHEAECKEDIRQAWAEMKVAYDNHQAFASPAPSTIVVFDVETSGLDPRKGQIVELAAEKICFSDDKLREKPYRCLVQLYDGRRMSEDVTRINHITNDMLQTNGININDVISRFVDFVGTSKCLLVAHNASFDMGFLEQAMIKCNKTSVLRGWDALDTLTVFKDRHPYPHKLANAISVYQLDNIAVNSHSAYDDTKALTQVLLKMAIERDDLLRYVNLFGFNPKYPPKYLVEGIKYIAQAYDRKRTLYEERDSKRKDREVQELIVEQNKHERPKTEKTITDMGTILICPDCNGKVSKRAERCPHCGCPISYVLQNASNNPHNFMAKTNGQTTQREEKEKPVVNESEGDVVKELIGETISYGGFGKCVITQIDDGRITFNRNDGKEYRVRMKDFERYGNFDSAEKADKFYKIFGETIQKQKEVAEKKPIVPYFDIFAENNSCGEYENEIDERMDDNYYIGDGDDWDEYY